MGFARYTHATISRTNPAALGCCDRCGFTYNHRDLCWQYDWRGPRLQNLRILVCETCLDKPQENGQRSIILPPDPLPIRNPRVDAHQAVVESSATDPTFNGAPNTLATESGLTITTESGQPLITEIGVTPTPTSSGYSG